MIDDITLTKVMEQLANFKTDNKQNKLQRRDQVVDINGMEFKRSGNTDTPATLYISTSKDLRYYQRFEFKIIMQPYLNIGGDDTPGPPGTIADVAIFIEGIDVTPMFRAQYGGAWIDNYGIFPKGDDASTYDVLAVFEHLHPWQQGLLLRPGYKKVEIKATGNFDVTLVQYLKYSHGGL